MELSEFDISYKSRVVIKVQELADFVAKLTKPYMKASGDQVVARII